MVLDVHYVIVIYGTSLRITLHARYVVSLSGGKKAFENKYRKSLSKEVFQKVMNGAPIGNSYANRYALGYKFCKNCNGTTVNDKVLDGWYITNMNRCPRCNNMLRYKPVRGRYKERLRDAFG